MKKYIVLVLLTVPFTSFAASSVRMLGGKPSTTTDNSAKVAPAKLSASTPGAISARVGTARSAKVKPASVSTGSVGTTSRFPSITPSHIYTSVVPTTNVNTVKPAAPVANVDTDEVVNTVMDNVANEYYSKDETYNKTEVYNKDEVYNNDEFDEAVGNIVNNNYTTNEFRSAVTKNQVFGGVKLGEPTNEEKNKLPENYVQIWIETAN